MFFSRLKTPPLYIHLTHSYHGEAQPHARSSLNRARHEPVLLSDFDGEHMVFWPFVQEWPEPDEETVPTSEKSCSSSLIGAGGVRVRHPSIHWVISANEEVQNR